VRLEQRENSCSVVLVGLGVGISRRGDLTARARARDRTGTGRDGSMRNCDGDAKGNAMADGDATGKVGVTDGRC
jgi:hypothetical protein